MVHIRTFVVDNNPAFLHSVAELISSFEQLQVVGEASSATAALEQIPLLKPDLVLMDMVMPGLSGLEATRLIKGAPRAPRVIICTLYADIRYEEAAKAAGADGFLPKSALARQLLPTVQTLFDLPAG